MVRLLVGLALIALPFAVVFSLLRITRRNKGSMHGGGLDRYRQIRNGR